ncbi:DUF2177 family protein [Sphingoaurantiacus capsulatus]|uniref:DUF2177 family protein n=1 Tax=Sphingoaurantiacus capsulatus TaxID=1771310 RepID=A0ABV7XAL1_9SPHN
MSRPPSTGRFLAAYGAALGTMLVLDALWLGFAIDMFRAVLGDMLLSDIRIAPAAIFYFGYVALVTAFAVDWATPNLAAAARRGAGLGLIGYGTYELTNYATMVPWTAKLVVIDMAWGAFVTAAIATMAQFVATKR